jgi:hypothetical protein
MSRPRGNKTSKAARAARQAKAVELISAGVKQSAIQEELGISRMTFWRDLQAIEARYIEGTAEDVKQFKQAQLAALMRLEEATIKGEVDATTAQALIRIRDSVAKLLGLNAETKHLRVNVNATANQNGRFHKFVTHVAGLSDVQLEDVFRFAASLPRDPLPEPAGPPLLEGEVL